MTNENIVMFSCDLFLPTINVRKSCIYVTNQKSCNYLTYSTVVCALEDLGNCTLRIQLGMVGFPAGRISLAITFKLCNWALTSELFTKSLIGWMGLSSNWIISLDSWCQLFDWKDWIDQQFPHVPSLNLFTQCKDLYISLPRIWTWHLYEFDMETAGDCTPLWHHVDPLSTNTLCFYEHSDIIIRKVGAKQLYTALLWASYFPVDDFNKP